jgi:hypothetical protein
VSLLQQLSSLVSERIKAENEINTEAKKLKALDSTLRKILRRLFQVMLQEVKSVPELWVKLFSIRKDIKNGFKIRDEDIIIHILMV